MTSQEKKIARLSKILTSVLKEKDTHTESYKEAYKRVLQSLEYCIEHEKNFNRDQVNLIRQAEIEEKQRTELREAMQKHHFKLLKEQIADRAANRGSNSEKRNWKIGEMKYEEGYVWKGMSRNEWRKVLDSQIKEKISRKEGTKQNEFSLDKERVDIAKQSLEEELKIKENEKKKRQNEMWESWEKTKEVHRLQKELEKVRIYGEPEQFSYVASPIKKKNDYFDEILKGYEGVFGKIPVGHSRTASRTGESIISCGRLTKKRSKSSLFSTNSYTSALVKLGHLTKQEEKLKADKDELMKLLEKNHTSKSNAAASIV